MQRESGTVGSTNQMHSLVRLCPSGRHDCLNIQNLVWEGLDHIRNSTRTVAAAREEPDVEFVSQAVRDRFPRSEDRRRSREASPRAAQHLSAAPPASCRRQKR
jgi:hypothetical protein